MGSSIEEREDDGVSELSGSALAKSEGQVELSSSGSLRSLKLKCVEGHVGRANPSIAIGNYGLVRVMEITHIPPGVTDKSVVDLYRSIVDLAYPLSRRYSEINTDEKILYK